MRRITGGLSRGLARTLPFRATQPWRAFSQQRGKEMDAVLPKKLSKYESFRPEIGDEATSLLKGMASATAEEVGAGVRAIRLSNGVKFLGDEKPAGDTIYERNFYPRLVSAIRGLRRRVILISNPGTGKSVFQYYLLARYANPSLFEDNDVPPPETIKFGHRHLPFHHQNPEKAPTPKTLSFIRWRTEIRVPPLAMSTTSTICPLGGIIGFERRLVRLGKQLVMPCPEVVHDGVGNLHCGRHQHRRRQ